MATAEPMLHFSEPMAMDWFNRLQASNPDTDDVCHLISMIQHTFTTGSILTIGGLMIGITDEAEDVLETIRMRDVTNINMREGHIQQQMEMVRSFVRDMIENPPARFLELLKWDALYECRRVLGSVLDVREDAELIDQLPEYGLRLYDLRQELTTTTRPRTTERYCLQLERYQENEETRERLVLVYLVVE